MSYLSERFEAAICELVGDGPIKQRLTTAYTEHLDDLQTTELPSQLRAAFTDLHDALHQVTPMGREPCVKATIRKMSTMEAGSHAGTIVQLYAELARQSESLEPLAVVNGGKRKPLPRFLTSGS